MQLLSFGPERAEPIREYLGHHASAVALASGRGEAHVYCLHFEAGGEIGVHEAGFAQLFLVVSGSGWVSGSDGKRRPVGQGEGAFIARGEVHAKGTSSGMTAIMVQLTHMTVSMVARAFITP
jgi:quercetin dioxygenase-like cupin family protein